jgi:hypothetical protein
VSPPLPGREQAESLSAFPFERLDFIYMPSSDVAADGAYFTEILGGRIAFAIEAMGTRVSMMSSPANRLTSCSPITSRANDPS